MDSSSKLSEQQIRREAAQDQVSRLVHGPYVYASLVAALWFSTSYPSDHPGLFYATVAALVLSSALRLPLILAGRQMYDQRPRRFWALVWCAVMLAGFANSILYVSSLLFYGFADWTFTVLLIWTVGSASGVTISFAPTRGLTVCYVSTLLGPALILGVWLGGVQGNTFAMGTGVLLSFLLAQGSKLHQSYWKQLEDRAKEEARLKEVEAARAAAEAANRAKSQFLANMSHEIRTPMHGILGMAQVALSAGGEPLPEESRRNIEVIQTAGQALLSLLNEILDFSKVEAGKLTLEKLAFPLTGLLEEIRMIITPVAASKGLRVDWSVDQDVPPAVMGDPARLRQVLLNLFGNAVKFTRQGSVGLKVIAQEDAASGAARLEFHITDTGIGIPADKHRLIFQAFAQADGSVTRQFGGTGLGLAISAQLVELMGGKLTVESEPGRGSTFRFALSMPLAASQPPNGQPATAGAIAAGSALRPLRILVGEDNPVNQHVAKSILEKRGHSVTLAGNGLEVLAAWESAEFDVILIDNQMPQMGGIEAIRLLRERERSPAGARRRTPAIMATASAMPGDREKFLEAGLDGYLAKPFHADELESALVKTTMQPVTSPQ